ncbi:MAG: YdcF family protein [Verrucomicrobia bacterium]|nr:YdcF family protein [Verrucomicrobiota bacterium]
MTLAACAALGVQLIFPFLAVSHPIGGDLLVVEGWVPDYSLAELRAEFDRGGYKLLVVTGNPMLKGEALSEYKNYADLTKAILLKHGWPEEKLVAVPCPEALRNRTYTAARALKDWIAKSGKPIRSLTVFSRGPHARRTWLLYRLALHGRAEVGIIASQDLRYDGNRWWTTSEGVRDVIDETIAYLYARFLFRPAQTND